MPETRAWVHSPLMQGEFPDCESVNWAESTNPRAQDRFTAGYYANRAERRTLERPSRRHVRDPRRRTSVAGRFSTVGLSPDGLSWGWDRGAPVRPQTGVEGDWTGDYGVARGPLRGIHPAPSGTEVVPLWAARASEMVAGGNGTCGRPKRRLPSRKENHDETAPHEQPRFEGACPGGGRHPLRLRRERPDSGKCPRLHERGLVSQPDLSPLPHAAQRHAR